MSNVTLSVDASSHRLGALIMQGKQPSACASTAFIYNQQGIAPIEKKLLAVIYGRKKFHQCIYGETVKVVTNNKSREPIFSKPLHQTPRALVQFACLQRMLYENVTYKPGK